MKIIKACGRVSLLVLSLCSAVMAADVELKPDHPDTYVVKKGDTLWDISGAFLTDPWLWPEIWHVNPQVGNPHLIFPGDVLNLVYIDGKPRLQFSGGEFGPQARVLSEGDAVSALPLDVIGPFLNGLQVVDEDQYNKAPYLLGGAEDRTMFAEGLKVYLKGSAQSELKNYSVFRRGVTYTDPDTQEVLGLEAIHLADASLIKAGDPATLLIGVSPRESKAGDRALPIPDNPLPPVFYPHAPTKEIEGSIISVYNGVKKFGRYAVVTLNRGSREGIEVGHVFEIYKRGQLVRDPVATERKLQERGFFSKVKDAVKGETTETVQLPDELAGELMVFRVFDKVSMALIMESSQPLTVLDKIKTPD